MLMAHGERRLGERLHKAFSQAARAFLTLLTLVIAHSTDLTGSTGLTGQEMTRKNELSGWRSRGPWSTMWAHSGHLKLNLPFVRPVFLLYGHHPGSVISLVDLSR